MKDKKIDIIVENLLKRGFSYSEIFSLMEKDNIDSIPISILKNRKLGMLESVTCYLKEEKNLKYSQIAKMLNRDQRTIWATYDKAKKKLK